MTTTRRRAVLGAAIMVPFGARAAGAPPVADRGAMGATIGRLQDELERVRTAYALPGIVCAFVLPDGRSSMQACGWDDVAARRGLSPQSRMMAGSVGKTFTAAAALELAMQGRISLDAPIAQWLGGRSWFNRLANAQAITVRHLLTQSSGLIDHVYTEAFVKAVASRPPDAPGSLTPEECVAFILDRPGKFAPGSAYAYTDTGYILAGMVIEQAGGEPFYALARRYFLDPLALTLTTPSRERRMIGLAQGYANQKLGFPVPPTTQDTPGVLRWNPGYEWCAGGFVSNPHDLAEWAHALYGGRAMAGDYLPQLLRGVAVDPHEPGHRYGLGCHVWNAPEGLAYGHGGWFPGYRTDMAYYPAARLALAFQINTDIGVRETQPMADIRSGLARVLLA